MCKDTPKKDALKCCGDRCKKDFLRAGTPSKLLRAGTTINPLRAGTPSKLLRAGTTIPPLRAGSPQRCMCAKPPKKG